MKPKNNFSGKECLICTAYYFYTPKRLNFSTTPWRGKLSQFKVQGEKIGYDPPHALFFLQKWQLPVTSLVFHSTYLHNLLKRRFIRIAEKIKTNIEIRDERWLISSQVL